MNKNCSTNKYLLCIFVVIFSLFGVTLCSGARLAIKTGFFPVLDGTTQATIVYNPSDPCYISNAYQELASYLQKATGKTFSVMTESAFNSSGKKLPIYVGNCIATQQAIGTQLAGIDHDGFMIVVESKRVFLAGPKDYSTYWAVCQFLEDYVGIRWLLPGTLGEDILPFDKIVITPVRRVEQPLIPSRDWWGDNWLSAPKWSLRQRVHHRYQIGHNMHTLFPSVAYCSSHPEYYTWYNGARDCGSGGWDVHICYTEPGTVPVAVQTVRDYFNSNPAAESFSFGQDDGTKWCQCSSISPSPSTHSAPYCHDLFLNEPYPNTDYFKIFGSDTRAADLYYYWLNQVADQLETTHPDKVYSTIAYGGNTCPPLNRQPHHKIMPYICHTMGDTYEPDYGAQVRWLIDSWGSKVDAIGLYDYAHGYGNVLPRIYTKQVQTMVQYAYARHLKAVTAEAYPNWGLDGPRLYTTARIWWNPFVDINDIFNDWNERMFREASAPMKNYFARCEQGWLTNDHYLREPEIQRLGQGGPWKINGVPVFAQGWRTAPFEIFNPAFNTELTGYLDQAAAIAITPIVKDRIQFYRKTWDLAMEFANAYWAGEGADLLVARSYSLTDVAASLKKMPSSYNLSYFQGQINTRIGTDYIAFYPLIDSYSWSLGCIPKPASISTYQWCGNQIAAEALTHPQAERQAYIDSRINEIFGTGGTVRFQRAVALIRHMAMDQSGIFPVIPQGNLMAYFEFKETSGNTAHDSTSHNLMATLINDVNWANDAQRGRCVYLDGTDDYMYFGTFGRNLDKDLTITCWTKTDDVTRGTGFIEGWTNSGVRKVASYLPSNYGGNINITWDGGGAPYQLYVSTSSIGYTSNNTWYHWAFTKNGTTGEIKLYLNGAKKATLTSSGGMTTLTDLISLTMGTMNNSYFKGYLDDISFWSKSLSDAEVTSIYTNGIDTSPPPIVWYKLNDRARNTATDFSGNNYNGTFSAPGVTWSFTTDQHGNTNWVLVFDGATGVVNMPAAVISQISNEITVTFWQKGNTGAQCDMFTAKKADNSVILSSRMPWVNGGNNYVTWDTGSPLDTISKIASASNYTGQWNHWAFTKNATTGQQKIYLNGTLWHSGTGMISSMSNGSTIQIGTGPDGYYSGLLSDFRIYNVELLASNITAIYSQ